MPLIVNSNNTRGFHMILYRQSSDHGNKTSPPNDAIKNLGNGRNMTVPV